MTVPCLSDQVIAGLLTYRDLIPLMEKALIAFSAGAARQPVRQMLPIEPEQRYLGIMPAVMPQAMGAKLVAFYPKNVGTVHHTHLASIVLFDPEFGQPLAVMDGRLITEMRTAATSAAVTRMVAAPNSRSLALLGSGIQAAAHLKALRALYPLDDVRVWSRSAEKARAFAQRHGAMAMPAHQAVEGADIVVCATNARDPVLKGGWLKPGGHVNSVGSPRPNWREVDDDVMRNIVIVDSREAAFKEAGDVILSGAHIHAEAGDVLSGKVPVDPSQTTVFKSVGLAVEDLAAARLVYDLYRSETGSDARPTAEDRNDKQSTHRSQRRSGK